MMICFELRFKELWKQLEGADVILVPSQWGMPRKRHLEILPAALAVMNQAYVVVANSSKADMASSSAIYSPNGGVVIDDMQTVISGEIDFELLKKMRRYIVMK
jgi:predicted amidohydrolase